MPDINYLAVLVAAVATMVVGYVWYGPLFSKMWMEGMGWDPNNQEQMAKMKKLLGQVISSSSLVRYLWLLS